MSWRWYLLCALVVVLIGLVGFAAWMRFESNRLNCAPGAATCDLPESLK